ncbi:MAG: CDP-alcohol phosphatidyltransferase family protein [Candidatus Odinarchaeota archaeon]
MSIQKFLAGFGKRNPDKGEKMAHKREDITVRSLRRLSEPLVDLVLPFSFITPNRVTWIGFFVFLLGTAILALAGDNVALLFTTGLMFWLSAVIDCMDGQLARKRGTSSKRGEWLDRALDNFKGVLFLLALGINISDSAGMFTLQLGSFSMQANTWFVIFIVTGGMSFLIDSTLHSKMIFNETQFSSFGNFYITWAFLILNLLELYLVVFTIITVIGVFYTLFEKTFLPQKTVGH